MIQSSPAVSVIITTHNRCAKLKRALDSVLTQTFKDFEVIIVDDASSDGTEEFLRLAGDPRVRSIRHTENRGGPEARNTGIRDARGIYIALLDDDDMWFPEKLDKQVKKMESLPEHVGVVYVGTEVFDERKRKCIRVNQPRYRGDVYPRLLLNTIMGSVSSALIRKTCFDKDGGFDPDLRSCQDWDMWLRIARHCQFEFVPEILARINIHGGQISTDYGSLIPGRTRMVLKHEVLFRENPDVWVVHLKRLGKLHCLNGSWSEAWPWFKKAVSVRRMEGIKIAGWLLLEMPRVKFFSSSRTFDRYVESDG